MPRVSTNGHRRAAAFAPEDAQLLHGVFDPQISPDGTRVAYLVTGADREKDVRTSTIWVAPADGRQPARRFTFGDREHMPRWSPDGRYLAFLAAREGRSQVYLAPLDGGEARALTEEKHGVNEFAWSPDARRIAYVARTGAWKDPKERKPAERAAPRVIRNLRYRFDGIGYLDDRRMHVFVADVETGAATQITDGDWYDQQPAWSPAGRTVAFVSDRERERHDRDGRADVWAVAATGGRARKLTRSRGVAMFPSFSPDGRTVSFIGHENGDNSYAKNAHLLVVPAAGGATRSLSARVDNSPLVFPPGQSYRWAPDGKSVLFLVMERGVQALYRTRVSDGACTRVLDGERQIQQFSIARDGTSIVFTAAWPSNPAELYATTLGARAHERNLSHANDGFIARSEPGRTRRLSHRAADGTEIESFVLYPPAYEAGKRYPTVLFIHGGPHGMHPSAGFQVRPHALASAGYVVLMPNPRGSSGYGERFTEGCVNDWGGGDYEDLMGAVDALVRKGIADPERLFVTGYSYGGFMTTWVVGHTDRFRAAIIGAPVSDHVSMAGTTDIPRFSFAEVGSAWDDVQAVWERSPVAHLPNCTTPVLIEHHEGDLRCPIGQAEEIFQALKLRRKEVEFLRYPGGFHSYEFFPPSQDEDYLRRQQAWFDGHGGRTAATASRNGRGQAALNGRAKASANGSARAKKRASARRRRAAAVG
jgi:dipeptidyl aminopeptidase/acylaminoacyl peptidase